MMSAELVKQLTERRQHIWHEAKGLLDAAASENRDLTAEESEKYDRLSTDLTALRARVDQIVESTEANRAAEESLTRMLGTPEERSGRPGDSAIEKEFRSMMAGESKVVSLSAESMRSAWGTQARALSKGTATAGGNTVPTSFRDRLVEHLVESSGMLQLGPTVLNTSSGEVIEVPVTTSHGAAGLVAEGASIAAQSTDPAFAKRTLGAFKYGQIITVARELVDDTAVDLLGYIARSAGRNVGLALGADLISGGGTTEPTGVLTTATAGKTGATTVGGAFDADDLIDLLFSVISPYRNSPSAGWLVRDASLGEIRKLKDGAGRYLFEPARTFGEPDLLLGKPIRTDPNVPAIATSAESVVFGDWSAYFVRMAGGVRFERSDEFAFNTDQVAFRCLIRADGLLVDQTGALKTFTGGAS